ncbi:MAG: sensor histidine kinase [Bacteroidota bacterium]
MNVWRQYKARVFRNCLNNGTAKQGLPYWHNRMFAILSVYLLPLSFVALIPGIVMSLVSDIPALAMIDFLSLVFITLLIMIPGLSVLTRKFGFIGVCYLLDLMLIYYLGSMGPGLIYLLGITLFVILIFPQRIAWGAVALNTVICGAVALAIYLNVMPDPISSTYSMGSWIAVSSNAIMLSAVATALLPTLFNGLQQHIVRQNELQRELQASNQEKQTLLLEMHHRVKNNLAVISSMLELQSLESDSQELQDKLMDSQRRIKSIASIHEMLYKTDRLSSINFGLYLKELVSDLSSTFDPQHHIHLNLDLSAIELPVNQAIPAAMIVNELIINSYKHAFPDQANGAIQVRLTELDQTVTVTIADDGVGMQQTNENATDSNLGMDIANILTNQLEGSLELKSDSGGITYRLHFMRSS